jgi:drug/metabolite transporter (DMT)-like permease
LSDVVLVAVLAGALLHATWNAVVKSGRDPTMDMVLVTGGAGALAAATLPFLPAPSPSSAGFALASGAVHVAYFALVAAAYRSAELVVAYPLMRGSAPLLVAVGAAAFGGERPGAGTWAGILLVSGGIFALALGSGGALRRGGAAVGLALSSAVVVASYTVVDGLGARRSGSPVAYTAWVFVLTALPLVLWAALTRRDRLAAHLRARWRAGLAGGACTLASYAIALWAMTRAPIAPVAALRETSILFGVVVAGLFLRERLGPPRVLAAGAVAAGVIALRLAG